MEFGRVGIGLARDELDDSLRTPAIEHLTPGRVGLGLVDPALSGVERAVDELD